MTLSERYQWAYGFAAFVTTAAYCWWLATQLAHAAASEVNYVPALLWTLGASFVIHSIGRGLAAGTARRTGAVRDERDRDVDRKADAYSFRLFSPLAAVPLALGLFGLDPFWITNTLFLAFAVTAVVGVLLRAVLYRRGA